MNKTDTLIVADRDIPSEVRSQLMECAVQNGRISYRWLCDLYRKGREDGRGASEGVILAAIDRLGGEVEGRPTHRINFLQRIDELRRIEQGQRGRDCE